MKQLTIFLALGTLALSGCATTGENDDAVAGAIVGGVVGGAIANNVGDQSAGKTAMGVVIGAAVGSALASDTEQQEDSSQEVYQQQESSQPVAAVQRESRRSAPARNNQSLRTTIHFDQGNAGITPRHKSKLKQLAKNLRRAPNKHIRIVGHTDNRESNKKKLSLHRAQAAKQYLVKHGVAGKRITVVARGTQKPRAKNSSKNGREKNRRVEIYLQ